MSDTSIYNRVIDILKDPTIKMEYTYDGIKVVYSLNVVYKLTRLMVDVTGADGKHIARHIMKLETSAPELIGFVAQYLPGDVGRVRRGILDDLLVFVNTRK